MALLPDLLPAGPVELRRWTTGHAVALRAAVLASFDELHPWMPWAAERPTDEGMRAVVAEGVAAFDAGTEWSFVVAERDRDDILGSVGLHPRGSVGTVELGYWIRTDVTGRGFATESARALTTAAFVHLLDVEQIEIRVDVANHRSGAVPARLGYRIDRVVSRGVDAPVRSGRWNVHVMDRIAWVMAEHPGR